MTHSNDEPKPDPLPWWYIDVVFKTRINPDDLWYELSENNILLPAGWELARSDYNECHRTTVAIFRVEHVALRIEAAEQVKAELARLEEEHGTNETN